MAEDDFDVFRSAVLADPELQARLRPISEWPEFIAAAIAAASERGLVVTEESVLAARDDALRTWHEQWV